MTWVAVGVGVGGLIGGVVASDSSRKAANTQSDAANAANGVQQQNYQDTVNRNQPFVQGGTTAYNALVDRLGLTGNKASLGATPSASDVMATPGYQFGLDQGQNQLNRQLTAKGMNYSGAQLKGAAEFGTNYATTKYDNAFNNSLSAQQQQYNELMGAAGIGQASANNTASAGQQMAAQVGNNLTGSANAQAANSLAQGNIVNNALNQGASAYKNYAASGTSGSQPTTYSGTTGDYGMGAGADTSTGGSYHPSDNYGATDAPAGGWAAGGPVMVNGEPVVGQRTPVPSGTGGQMSKQAIVASLLQTMQPKQGVAALPTNPVMNPQGIVAGQMRQAGAYSWGGQVQGPGTQTSDSIPARLSNGEHVMDAASVTALGGGDNAKGQNMLNVMRSNLKKRGK